LDFLLPLSHGSSAFARAMLSKFVGINFKEVYAKKTKVQPQTYLRMGLDFELPVKLLFIFLTLIFIFGSTYILYRGVYCANPNSLTLYSG
jgi:hypothetical protein